MAIEYVEIRDINRQLISIIDTAKSIIWHTKYYSVGDFEIYVTASPDNIAKLQRGNYVTRPDDIEIGIIEKINVINNEQDGKMIVASGRFAKSILDRRLIYNLSGTKNTPTILRGNVEAAARSLVNNNAINCSFDASRNFGLLELGALAGLPAVIVEQDGDAGQKQVSYQNLLDYSDELLQEYGYGSIVMLDDDTKKLQYVVYAGQDRSIDSASALDPVVFSQEFDNIVESEYTEDETQYKNIALIGGEGEDLKRFFTLLKKENKSDINRRETFIDASSINRTYQNEGEETERTYTAAEYRKMLNAQGLQDMAEMNIETAFSGVINASSGQYVLNRDFSLGDLVTVQDNDINKYINVRITEVTEVQDENGYTCAAQYE